MVNVLIEFTVFDSQERGSARVQCHAQERNIVTLPRLKPGPHDPESSMLNKANMLFSIQSNIIAKIC